MTNKENINEAANNEQETEESANAEAEQKNNEVTPEEETKNIENNELDEYKAKAEEYLQLLQRTQADFDNFRKRINQEREEWVKYSSMKLAASLLPVLDNFERALISADNESGKFKEGIELIYRQLVDVLTKDGVKPMEVVGKEFDPKYHEAVMQGPSEEYPENTVIEELQKGYMFADKILRPAMVKVAKN